MKTLLASLLLVLVLPRNGSADDLRESPHPRAAVLDQPDLHSRDGSSSPGVIAAILKRSGFDVRRLSAQAMADAAEFNTAKYALAVIPSGASFPAEARQAMVSYLQAGGSLITTGGYAFHRLVRRVEGRWVEEQALVQQQFEQATRRDRSLLPNGSFEAAQDIRQDGFSLDGQWRRASQGCRTVEDSPQDGRYVAMTTRAEGSAEGAHYWLDLPAKAGASYQVSGSLRSRDVGGPGMAFIAMYQFDAQGQLVEFCDFAKARGTTPWQHQALRFTPKPNVARLHISMGLYNAHGTAWFDDLRLCDVTGLSWRPMNTSSGVPRDGLVVAPEQIGMFDASFPLKRACRLRAAPGQHLFREPVEYDGELIGWAASGVVGYDNARWIPLLETYDRYGRLRGAAGAMLVHYQGPFAGSCWAYFGVENVDLFAKPDSPTAHGLGRLARFLVQKTFLHNLNCNHRLYRPDESAVVAVLVDNRGLQPRRAVVEFSIQELDASTPSDTIRREVEMLPGTSQRVEATFSQIPATAAFGQVTARLHVDGELIDQMTTGFVVEQPSVLRSGPRLTFSGNYFQLDGRPMFLFGSDTYSVVYRAACENPCTWRHELGAARDMGVNLYEVLQYTQPDHHMQEDDWRSFRALAQLTQSHRLVFMPGMLIGHNVAIGDTALTREDDLCRQYAQQLGQTPGLLWYINGDYALDTGRDPSSVKRLWNGWLKAEHGSTERIQAVWGAALQGELGSLDFPPPNSGRWDDAAAVDRCRFLAWLTTRWNKAHVDALRAHDNQHPITSEYYSLPLGGLDLIRTIDGQDVSNFGFFDRPRADIESLPWRIRFNDLRCRGKGVSLGEYGVKTHPAWTEANGAQDYHVMRSEDEQKRLFLAVAHYALGLGACKVQNWCLRDDSTQVFPWGIFYPNQLIPKDIAYVHRNTSLVWRHFRPVYQPAAITVCLANRLREGNEDHLGTAVANRVFADLLALHYPFDVIDDDHLDHLPPATRAILYPAPLALHDETFARLLAWVRGGGTLLVTGDLSRDEHRQPTRAERLKQLAGVELLGEHYPPTARTQGRPVQAQFTLDGLCPQSVRPAIRIKPLECDVLGRTSEGEPVLVRHAAGKGNVYLLTDPLEIADDPLTSILRRQLYGAVLRAANPQHEPSLSPLAVLPNEPWLHAMNQATAEGTVHVLYNTKAQDGISPLRVATCAGQIELSARNGWPAMAAVAHDGRVLAAVAHGEVTVADDSLMRGHGLKALLALDAMDLRRSGAILVAPFEPGRLELPKMRGPMVAILGESRDGRWTPLEQVDATGESFALDFDTDRATAVVLICRAGESDRWATYLSEAMQHPERIRGH